MIVYSKTKADFISDVRDGLIADLIEEEMKKRKIGFNVISEHRAWQNSLHYMKDVLDDEGIDGECKVAVELQIPLTSKRVDFIICGCDEYDNNNVVIVELKQWDDSKVSGRPDVVYAYTGNAMRFVTHPSYQAYSYAKIIENFNESVNKYHINFEPCSYLHNYSEKNRSHIQNKLYEEAISLAPIFLARDRSKLTDYIKKFIKKKDSIDILYQIDHGKLKPSKSLQEAVVGMFNGNKEFYLIDEQKVAYEIIKSKIKESLRVADKADNEFGKYTIIVEGGPGTGKSVVALQLLCDLIKNNYSALYATKTTATREVYFKKLRQEKYKLSYLKSLFVGTGSFIDAKLNYFDCIIVDEAHRLMSKSGMFHNLGQSQIKEIIHASKVSVFFIDEDQIVTSSDVGTIDEIIKRAKEEGSKVIHSEDLKLVSQFRCNGSDGYLNFLDNLLGIKETANTTFDLDYELRLFNSPSKMREELRKKNFNNKARMVAGYCYDWITKDKVDSSEFDINLEDDFHAKRNFSNTKTWAIDENSFDEVGCIHTSQGLEFDYCGVIIGKDLEFINNRVVTNKYNRAKTDQSLNGIKKKASEAAKVDRIIRNTYKVLLTRGMKGSYIYCEDKNLLKYISEMTGIAIE